MNAITPPESFVPAPGGGSPRAIEVLPPRLRRTVRAGFIVVAGLALLLIAAASIIQVRGAVVAVGAVGTESRVMKIAHPTGGVVAAVLVQDGSKVRAGQILMRLDTHVSNPTSTAAGENLDQLRAREARLQAEASGHSTLVYPPELTNAKTPSAESAMADERRNFASRTAAREGQRSELEDRVSQSEQQIAGYQVQIDSANQQQALIKPELDSLRMLWKKQLVTINRLNELERTAVDLKASVGSLEAQIAGSRAQIAELKQAILQLDQDSRSQAGTELAEVEQHLADERIRAAVSQDSFNRSVIRAPAAGVVDQLAFTTIGGVIPPGEPIMRIVPDEDTMSIEAKLKPSDIDQVAPGRVAMLRFSAFSAPSTPTIKGHLTWVSADRVTDPKTEASYFRVIVTVDRGELARLGSLTLVPGMPVEAMIQSSRRSLLSYIFKPLHDQLDRAFHES